MEEKGRRLECITRDELNELIKKNKVELISGPKILSISAPKRFGEYTDSNSDDILKNIIGNAPEEANAYMDGYPNGPVRCAVYENRIGYNHIPIIYLKIKK